MLCDHALLLLCDHALLLLLIVSPYILRTRSHHAYVCQMPHHAPKSRVDHHAHTLLYLILVMFYRIHILFLRMCHKNNMHGVWQTRQSGYMVRWQPVNRSQRRDGDANYTSAWTDRLWCKHHSVSCPQNTSG